MNHDITFCANSDQCHKAPTCRRAHPPMDVEVSLASFFEKDTRCRHYWPTGEFGMPTFKGGTEMTPAELMDSCCDPHTAPAFKNDFWVITQEELERFHRRAQAQALREAAENFMADKRNFFAMTLFRRAEELENLK